MSRAAPCLASMKVHVLRRQPHRLPVEPAFEQQRPARARRARIAVLQLRLQPVELLVGKVAALLRRIDQRARRPRRIVEQRLVPAPRRVVDVERHQRGLQRRETVVVVERMEQRQMQRSRACRRTLILSLSKRAERTLRLALPSRYSSAVGQPAASVSTVTRSGLQADAAPARLRPIGATRRDHLDIGVARQAADARRAFPENPRPPGAGSAAPAGRAADARRARPSPS